MIDTLLYLDTNTIYNISICNKDYYNKCKDVQFWTKKFNHDILPVLTKQQTVFNWLSEYKYVNNALINTYKLIQDTGKTATILFNNHIIFYTDMTFLPVKFINNISNKKIWFNTLTPYGLNIEFINNKYIISYMTDNQVGRYTVCELFVSFDEFLTIILKMYYYCEINGKNFTTNIL